MGYSRKKDFGQLIRLDNMPNARIDGEINPVYFGQFANQIWNFTIHTIQDWSEGEEKLGRPVWTISVDPRGIVYSLECEVIPALENLEWFAGRFQQGPMRNKVTEAMTVQAKAWAVENYEYSMVVDEQSSKPVRIKSIL